MTGQVSSRSQLSRLLQLLLALRGDRFPNARELARECEVSVRTVYRDLDTLRLAGFNLRYSAEFQGYRLDNPPGALGAKLDEEEVLALLILAKSEQAATALGLGRAARHAVLKLIDKLPQERRDRLQSAYERIRAIPQDVCPIAAIRQEDFQVVLEGLASERSISALVGGQGTESDCERVRLLPYQLFFRDGEWWLLAASPSRPRAPRVYRLSALEQVVLETEVFRAPRHLPSSFLGLSCTGRQIGEGEAVAAVDVHPYQAAYLLSK